MTNLSPKTGTLHGVGVGPGDPELMTVKAARLIATAPVLAYFAKKGRRGNARAIIDPQVRPGTLEVPLYYPLTTEMSFADPLYVREVGGFYAEAAAELAVHLEAGRDVVLVAEGDPMFYGSFMHLFIRLKDRFPVEVTPGVTGMAGCWAAAQQPMTWGDDILTVLPGTLDEAALTERLAATDAAVIMKLGSNYPKVRRAIARAGLLARALYVERGTMAGESVERLADKTDETAPYFSLILIPGEGRRP
ncbi:precorrin-2 C(20)-methyltransferase [Oryzibacter oryziterrae]|uniref:precorrin-2 C(20)-methyltransferase n=1 Tax=Oryzibacter oryziterrae TaxID=2766474 RepID=UPI001F01DB11|nr:precorrin-2 C(20)-methyltransferase [Oryzibacter oryziterrae]